MTVAAWSDLVGQHVEPFADWPEAAGEVLSVSSERPPFLRVRGADGQVRRLSALSLRHTHHPEESTTMTTAAVTEAQAFRITLPGGESHRVVADTEDAAKKALRVKLEITRLPKGCTVEPWTATKTPPAPKPAKDAEPEAAPKASKKGRPAWRDLPDAELAEHLLSHPTLGDKLWADRANGAVREKGERRETFIRRVLLGETVEAAA